MPHASHRPSPAPMSTPSRTTTRAAPSASWTAGSGVKSGGTTEWSPAMTSPRASPPHTPQRIIVPMASRTAIRSPAPRARPVMACAAIARASSAKARNDQTVIATWWAARVTSPSEAASRVRAQPGLPGSGLDEQHGDEREAHAGLGDDGAPRGSGDSPVKPVDEDEVEHDVGAEA